VCATGTTCAAIGYTIVGIDTRAVADRLSSATNELTAAQGAAITLFDEQGAVLASTDKAPPRPSALRNLGDIQQQQTTTNGRHVATAYTQFTLAGRPAGVVAVAIPASTAFSSASGPALRLVALLVLAMIAAVAVGAALSRWILRQLRAVVHTSRELGSGNLSARAPVLSSDEHGELALALNRMAEQLQAEHDTLELQVEERTEEIRRLLADRTEFFAGLSHELRTPLAVITTQAEMLLEQPGDEVISSEAGTTVKASAEQLLDVVNAILNMARAEAGSIEVHIEAVHVAEVMSDVADMLRHLGAASGVDVHLDQPQQLPAVRADAGRLREILVNLVSNAIKYTPAGGRVDVSARAWDGSIDIVVADTGVGIPLAVGDRVFEPFFRVPGSMPQRGQPSSGLGLAITRRLVEALGGTITWQPNGDRGTVFTVTLIVDRSSGTNGHERAGVHRAVRSP
jgi:signal transduction histidine kinase